LGSIAQYLHPSQWAALLQASVDNLGYAAFWLAVLQIIVINLLLSGDNAVVIAMACRGLPPRQRFWGMVIGAGVAVALRVGFTVVIASLMQLSYLKLAGGLALFIVAARLLLPEKEDKNQVSAAAHLWLAVWIVVVADIVMSLDNVIAVAAAAEGNLALLAIGLALSVPVIVAAAALVAVLLDRFPILVWAGAALLGWIAGKIIATDPAVLRYVSSTLGENFARQTELAAAGAGVLLVIGAGGLWRQLSISRARVRSADRAAS
jgi:YjbE family integral membrane protein